MPKVVKLRSCGEKPLKEQKPLKFMCIYLCFFEDANAGMYVPMITNVKFNVISYYHWILLCAVALCYNLCSGIISIALRKLVTLKPSWDIKRSDPIHNPWIATSQKKDAILRLRVLWCPETILHRSEQFEVAKKICKDMQNSQAEFYPRISILLNPRS